MLRTILNKASDFIELKLEILKLTLIEKIALVMGFCMLIMFGISCTLCILLLLGMGLSHYFASLTGSLTSAYFITTTIYLALMALALLMRKRLLKLFADLFVNLLTDDAEHTTEQ